MVGIILATFFSDFSHEMCTAVLPLYLATAGFGPASLGIIEGVADFFLVGVGLFGLGDFSRTFLIWLAARGLGEDAGHTAGAVSIAVLLYTLHNLVSAGAAFPIGHLGDRRSKLGVLLVGYCLGVGTNGMVVVAGGCVTGHVRLAAHAAPADRGRPGLCGIRRRLCGRIPHLALGHRRSAARPLGCDRVA